MRQLSSLVIIGLLCFGIRGNAFAQVNILTRVPSSAAEPDGIITLIKVPPAARFVEGAPIAVYNPGGFKSTGIGDKDAGLVLQGFIEIQFNFPGNDNPSQQSGGVYDTRGPLSLRAQADVLRFAGGSLQDVFGRTLADITAPIVPDETNLGIIGYSNGGNTNICVAGVHGDECNLAWILNWESPVGDGMPQAECGAKLEGQLRPLVLEQNPAYDPDTGNWGLDSLAYHPDLEIPILDDISTAVYGGLYFDFDEDGDVDAGADFVPYPLVFETDSGNVAFYSERLRNAAQRDGLFPDPPPDHIPTRDQTEEFWRWRNGAKWIQQAVRENPDLMFMIVGSEIDHVQRSPDHPHILLQYEQFRNAGARFVRLNPDRTYVEAILASPAPDAVDNPAFVPFDHISVRDAVEPGSFDELLGRDTIVPAAACELADRTHYGDLRAQIDVLITAIGNPRSVPSDFALHQNYPNPFNPKTVITIALPKPGWTTLDVYNLLGQKVHILMDAKKTAGTHRVVFDASQLPSGVYFYRLEAGDFISVKKMEVLK